MTHFSGEKKEGGIRGFLCLLLSVSQGKPEWRAKEGSEGGEEEVGKSWGWSVGQGVGFLTRGAGGLLFVTLYELCTKVHAGTLCLLTPK